MLKIVKKYPYLICTLIYVLLISYSYVTNPFYIERMQIADGTMITKGAMLRKDWYYFSQNGVEYRLACLSPIMPSSYCEQLPSKLWVYNAEIIAYPSLCKVGKFFTKSEKWCKFIFTAADFKESLSAKMVIEYRLPNEIIDRDIKGQRNRIFYDYFAKYLFTMIIIAVYRYYAGKYIV